MAARILRIGHCIENRFPPSLIAFRSDTWRRDWEGGAGRRILESLPSSLGLKFEFVDLDGGFDYCKTSGNALPEKTVGTL